MATTSVQFKDPFVREYARRIQMGEVQPPAQLAGMFAGNGYFDPSQMDALYNAINQLDPQGSAAVRARVGDVRGADTSSLGGNDQLTWKSAADENDWFAPVMAIAGPIAGGYFNGAFSGLGSGLEGAGAGLDISGGLDGLPAVADPSWAQPTAGGVADTGFGAGTPSMPPAQVPTAQQYADWGMKEVSPGVFTQGGVAPGAWQVMLNSGVPAATISTVASNTANGMSLKDAMSAAGIAAPIAGAVLGSSAIRDASKAQGQATADAISQINGSVQPAIDSITAAQLAGAQGQKDALGVAREDLKPWRDAGSAAITDLGALVSDPNSSLMRKFTVADFMDDPVTKLSYQTGLDQGTKQLQSSARSRGTLNSGGTLKALEKFGIDYTGGQAGASRDRFVGDHNNTYSRLMGVSNVGQDAVKDGNSFGLGVAGNIANSENVAATNKANIQIGAGRSVADLISGGGNARGAAAIAQGNTIGNAANSIGNWWSSQQTLDKILAARK